MLKILKENKEKGTQTTSCPMCGSSNAKRVRESVDLVECLDCETAYMRTRLNFAALKQVYQSYAGAESHMSPPETESEIISSPLRREDFMLETLEFVEPEGKALDVGCGWGAFLLNARERGFEPYGIEITENVREYARLKLNIPVVETDFIAGDYAENDFSLVAMIHSLEHLPDPAAAIEKSYAILKPDGVFCGIVPNFGSFASKTLKDAWEWLDPQRHLTYFTPATLEKSLSKSGFEILRIYTTKGDYNSADLKILIKKVFNLETESEIIAKMQALAESGEGEEIRFFARKINRPKMGTADMNEKIEIEIKPGDDPEEILADFFSRGAKAKKLFLLDKENVLPDYADKWNGVEVVRGEKSQKLKKHKIAEKAEDAMNMQAMNRLQFEEKLSGGFSNKAATGILPDPLPSPLYVNLGCGADVRENFVNVDLFSDDERVVAMDVRDLKLPDNSVDLLLASDILEHFSHREIDALLKEWARVLKSGGELIIRCPSLKLQVQAYMRGDWNADVASYMIFGGQTNPGDYHCVAFDKESITRRLNAAGFVVNSVEEEDAPQDRGFINLNMTVRANIPQTEHIREKKDLTLFEDNFEKTETPTVSKSDGAEFSGKPKLNIVWEGSQFVYHSLALINREHCSNIIDSGQANLTIVPYEPDKFAPQGNAKYEKLLKNDVRFKPEPPEDISGLPYAWIRHQWPPKAEPPKGAKWIIMQPWEYTQLKKDFAEIFKRADEIWTPSTYSRKCIVDSGVDFNRVQVIPNGVDPDLFKPKGGKYPLETKKRFKFLFVGGTIFRKGIDLLLQAYIQSFKSRDDTVLVIKDMGGDSFYKNQTAKQSIEKIQKNPNSPEIVYIDEYLTEEEMANLYRACDVFACPYRGEGFSLPTLEAMACGLPVIVTKGGATDDFVDEKVGWRINAKPLRIGDNIDGEELTGDAYLLQPDLSELSSVLRGVFDEPSGILQKGIAASMRARTDWTWKKSTLKILTRLDMLYGKTMGIEARDKLRDEKDASILMGEAEERFFDDDEYQAEKLYKKALDAGQLSDIYAARAFDALAYTAILRGDFEEAENYIARSGRILPDRPDSVYLKVLTLKEKGEFTEALEEITPLLEKWAEVKLNSALGISLDEILTLTGEIFIEMGDLDGANRLFKEALKFNDQNYRACYGAGVCFKKAGALEEAKTMFQWAVNIKENFADAVDELHELEAATN